MVAEMSAAGLNTMAPVCSPGSMTLLLSAS